MKISEQGLRGSTRSRKRKPSKAKRKAKAGKPNRDRLERKSGLCSEEVPGDDVLVGSVVPLLGLEVRDSELFKRTQVVSLNHEQKREI